MRLSKKPWFWMALSLFFMSGVAHSQGVFFPEPSPTSPTPNPPRVESLQVEVAIADNVATTHVTQVFRNPNDRQMEGTFIFPLPEGAVISEFAMFVDGEKVAGELLEKGKATRAYEEIVRQVRDPALLEYVGRNALRVRIFPIPAHSEKKVELEYSEVIPYADGLYKYVYPLKAAQLTRQSIGSVSFAVDISSQVPITTVFSPTHATDEYVKGPRLITAGWEAGESLPDRDFVLFYGVSEKEFGISLAAHRTGEGDGYFLLLISPKREVEEKEVLPKDIIFVFDKSGSMGGEKIREAKAALKFCLESLNKEDRFGLITFSTEVNLFRPSLTEATAANINEASALVESLSAEGGTNVNEALLGALQMVWEANTGGVERTQRPTMMVFLTDGLPTVGETNVEQILEKVARNNNFDGQKARIFTFGVGNDVNTNLLDGLAAKNKGASQYVREGEDIEVAVSSFFTKVSRPVLSNLKLDFGGIQASKMYPREIPDLFAGSTLTIFGRYEGNGKATVTLTGETDATAEPGAAKYEYPLEFPEGEKANDFLPRLWASRRIGYLLDEMRLHGESDELKDEVVELSLKYGIMTPYTSYLVLEKNSPLRAEVTRLSQRQQTTFPDQRRYSVAGQQGPAGPPGQITEEEVGAGLKSQEGAQAVAASVEVQGMKQTEQAQPAPEEIDAANLVNLARLQQERKAPQEALALQQVGDKSFVQIDSAWVDLEAQNQEGAAVMGIQYLSDAYFEAVSLVPDLGKYFALGERVTLRIGNLIIQVVEPQEEGQTLTDEQREQLKGGQP